MESAGDESLESYKIAALREQLLQQPPHHGAYDIRHAIQDIAKDKASQRDPNRDAQRRLHHSPNTKLPRLKPAGSAPAMGGVLREMASETQQRSQSFAGVGGMVDGDTQVMPSQIYKDHVSMIMNTSGLLGPDSYDGTAETGEGVPRAIGDGNSTHVDLMQHWTSPAKPAVVDIDDDEASGGEDADESQTKYLLSSLHRSGFKTPATAGYKRNYRGEVIPSTTSTKAPGSGYSAFFPNGGDKGPMSLSQLFHATQERSSPQDAPRSDPVFARPSPNFNHSSPVVPLSSPSKANFASRAYTEPRDTYTSMKESQEKRKQRMDSAELRQMRRMQRNIMSDHALQEWENMKAPSRPDSRSKTQRAAPSGRRIDFLTLAKDARPMEEVVEIPDDVSDATADQSVDEYDEYTQEVISSQKPAARFDSPELRDGEVLLSPSPSPSRRAGYTGDEEEQDSHRTEVQGSAPIFAVADSQPENSGLQSPAAPVGPSSMTSIVPGSQVAAQPSQKNIASGNPENSSTEQRVPSSPPMLPAAPEDMKAVDEDEEVSDLPDTVPPEEEADGEEENGRDAVLEDAGSPPLPDEQDDLHDEQQYDLPMKDADNALPDLNHKPAPQPSQPTTRTRSSTIPETDPAEHHRSSNTSKSGVSAPFAGAFTTTAIVETDLQQTHSTAAAYEAAPTHLSNPSLSLLQASSLHSSGQVLDESPQKATAIRSFRDIAADPTPPDAIKDVDVDIDIMTADDYEFLAVTGTPPGPAKKRQRVYGKANRGPPRKPLSKLSSTNKSKPTAAEQDEPVEPAEPGSSPPVRPTRKKRVRVTIDEVDSSAEQDEPQPITPARPESPIPPTVEPLSPPSAAAVPTVVNQPVFLRGEEDKETSRVPTATPSPTKVPDSTPPSVRKREQAGAHAISQLVSARGARFSRAGSSVGIGKLNSGRLARPTKTRGKSATDEARGSKIVRGAKQAQHTTVREIAETPQSKPHNEPSGNENAAEEPSMPPPQPAARGAGRALTRMDSDAPVGPTDRSYEDVVCPDRVLALFKGTGQAYYPATCVGTSNIDGFKLRVRFDDGTTTQIEQHSIRRLQFRKGDLVKVDLPKMRNKTYSIVGFSDRISRSSEEEFPKADIHGHSIVELTPKQRDSLPGVPVTQPTDIVFVHITSIYLTQSMWSHFADRPYIHIGTSFNPSSHLSTPLPNPDTAAPITPLSRARRTASLLGTSRLRAESSTPSLTTSVNAGNGNGGIFTGMAFAVSYLRDGAGTEKERVLDLLQSHGARLLDIGFDELFEVPELPDPSITTPGPKNTTSTGTDSSGQGSGELKLKPEARVLGFVALIADHPSRRAKYMQALALGLPCLSGRWVLDSADKGKPLAWPKYLLAAGESVYLGGATKSRMLAPYDIEGARLEEVVRRRERLLADAAVADGAGDVKG
ncbi:radiation sensitive protein rad9 [Taxawa tesnikishii (nom. ined.)]|nr:radiation sensitive protein rad9 [Dothideales sp. JES 119]